MLHVFFVLCNVKNETLFLIYWSCLLELFFFSIKSCFAKDIVYLLQLFLHIVCCFFLLTRKICGPTEENNFFFFFCVKHSLRFEAKNYFLFLFYIVVFSAYFVILIVLVSICFRWLGLVLLYTCL